MLLTVRSKWIWPFACCDSVWLLKLGSLYYFASAPFSADVKHTNLWRHDVQLATKFLSPFFYIPQKYNSKVHAHSCIYANLLYYCGHMAICFCYIIGKVLGGYSCYYCSKLWNLQSKFYSVVWETQEFPVHGSY